MGAQEILVVILFIAALIYVGNMIYKNFNAKKSCGSNCKCGIDFSDLPDPEKK
ncbi:FeoB-associated Cys-rich membrane protein [Arcticibacter sp. MXS-1]|uniref:FeoB-associated Cys-rich membrane protein n=1 Tax=Arcticibacter sp. MXS-1 TaxID=3341726 RepID=UPI0035A8FFA7